ncbi:glycine zipper 2TM domain-containing protein [Novosphingobium sp. BL-8H]|uniref:glycine zipper 2TM domain-containing protein n=1 Tax=Novosphingobium sp. BL-8H TaxID=3127640 RepID=UPI0037578F51
MKKLLLALSMASAILPMAPASADPYRGPQHGGPSYGASQHRPPQRDYRYDSRGRYRNPPRVSRNDHVWRGRDGRYYCKRDNGTTGLIIGAGVGALAGHEIAGSGDQTLGAIIGGVAGGLLGREVDRGDLKCY